MDTVLHVLLANLRILSRAGRCSPRRALSAKWVPLRPSGIVPFVEPAAAPPTPSLAGIAARWRRHFTKVRARRGIPGLRAVAFPGKHHRNKLVVPI